MAIPDIVNEGMSTLGAALNTVPSLLSLGGGLISQATSAASTREQMRFQERMSSTAWQRGVKDMRKAGINPMLAFMQGGASTPTGASFGGEDVVTPAISTARQGMRLKRELSLLDEQVRNVQADTAAKGAQADLARHQALEVDTRAEMNNVNARTLWTQLPGLINQRNADRTWFGKAAPYVRPLWGAALDAARVGIGLGRGLTGAPPSGPAFSIPGFRR